MPGPYRRFQAGCAAARLGACGVGLEDVRQAATEAPQILAQFLRLAVLNQGPGALEQAGRHGLVAVGEFPFHLQRLARARQAVFQQLVTVRHETAGSVVP